MRGKWKHYSETITDSKTGQTKEIKYYYQVDNNGNILFDKSPLSEDEMNNKNIPLIAPIKVDIAIIIRIIISVIEKAIKSLFLLKTLQN